jgi:hypothetical protein
VKSDGESIAIKNERHTMHLLFAPVLASALYIGGGSVGLLLVIVVVVLLLRRERKLLNAVGGAMRNGWVTTTVSTVGCDLWFAGPEEHRLPLNIYDKKRHHYRIEYHP